MVKLVDIFVIELTQNEDLKLELQKNRKAIERGSDFTLNYKIK
jgi:hypothetical protein